jgi:hypothetical protein
VTIGAVSTIVAQHPKIVYLKDMEGHTTTAPHNHSTLTLMRKIEKQMCAAVQANKDWQSGNTSVHFDAESGVSVVRLHGNKIAEIDDTSMTIFDGGWQTVTTKSRLNALCDEFCIAGEGVFQKDFKWFVRKFVAESSITGKVFNVEDFSNGYIFA